MSHWIKIEVTTPDKPEIRAAARICKTSPAEAFAAFFRLWTYLDAHTSTGFVNALTISDLDEISRLPKFGAAMETVGWISASPDGITVANWDRHNGDSAKKRAANQKRMQRVRATGRWK